MNSNTSRYLGGWEIDFSDEEQLKKILLTQGVNKNGMEFFKEIQTSTELVLKDNSIIEVIRHTQNNKKSEKINYVLPIIDWPDRNVFFLHKDGNGIHSIGGETPIEFEIPICDKIKSSFIYLASIDTKDSHFGWINAEKLHIAYPIYEGAFKIFFDYQNPNHPKILNPDVFDYTWIDENVKGTEKVKFIKQKYNTIDDINYKEISDDYLISGVPLWYQYPDIPICPKNGKVMRYVTTINSDRAITIQNSDGIENLPFEANYLIFGDYGHLFIFYEPDSKVLYMDVQF